MVFQTMEEKKRTGNRYVFKTDTTTDTNRTSTTFFCRKLAHTDAHERCTSEHGWVFFCHMSFVHVGEDPMEFLFLFLFFYEAHTTKKDPSVFINNSNVLSVHSFYITA